MCCVYSRLALPTWPRRPRDRSIIIWAWECTCTRSTRGLHAHPQHTHTHTHIVPCEGNQRQAAMQHGARTALRASAWPSASWRLHCCRAAPGATLTGACREGQCRRHSGAAHVEWQLPRRAAVCQVVTRLVEGASVDCAATQVVQWWSRLWRRWTASLRRRNSGG